MYYSLISQLFNIKQNMIRFIKERLNCIELDSISTSIDEYYNNKKLSLKHN